MKRSDLSPYLSALRFGFSEGINNWQSNISDLTIYAALLIIYYQIYTMVPMHEFGVEGLTHLHLFWYFVATEAVIVGSPSLVSFGHRIKENRLGEMIQKPTNHLALFLCQQMGTHIIKASGLFMTAFISLSLINKDIFPVSYTIISVLLFQMFLGCFLLELLGYAVSTAEILGPYSRPLSWILSKLVFVFGGLFLPIIYFPEIIQNIAFLTPFSAILYSSASSILDQNISNIGHEILRQIFWIVLTLYGVIKLDKKTIHYVLERGLA